jgi:hypothetical protein
MISSINNSLNWACHRNSTFGYGGYVSFRNNSISQFINIQLTSSMFEILLNEKSIVIIFVKLHVLHGISVRSPW